MEKRFPKIARINPSFTTSNLGDYIIDDYCRQALKEIFGIYVGYDISSRDHLSRYTSRVAALADFTFICGTNILSSNLKKDIQWSMCLKDAMKIHFGSLVKRDLLHPNVIKEKIAKTHVIGLGLGWHGYQGNLTKYTKKVLSILLDKEYLHSVRDAYTEEKLKKNGFGNVINTACPTMWNLTPEHCAQIPAKKASRVVCTLTDYCKDYEADRRLIELLLQEYEQVFLWLQSAEDQKYISDLSLGQSISIIPPTLESYDNFLCNRSYDIDYIGTRLHGGIRALNHKIRSCIIAVDNRASEIGKDTGLTVIKRKDLSKSLMNWIYEPQKTVIHLPKENIQRWKDQFLR